MLRLESALNSYEVAAEDGKIGSVSDLLFDDKIWAIRWFVIETGGWLGGRKVLIHPSAVGEPDDLMQVVPVLLTKAQIEGSPGAYEQQPVSRQMEERLYGYYGWDPLWTGQRFDNAIAYPLVPPPFFSGVERDPASLAAHLEHQDPHLRSVAAVKGYHMHATDGEIGHLKSVLVEDESWTIRYLVVDTSNWWLGHQVLLALSTVTEIDWSTSQIRLNVTIDQVKHSPVWEPAAMVSHDYERRLQAHYRWPGYGVETVSPPAP